MRMIAVVSVLVLALAPAASAQDGFRISYEMDKSLSDKTRVVGRVANERSGEVLDVSITAEALDARGRVLASGITYVDARIAAGDSRPFVATVPAVAGVTRYRVRVSSFRAGLSEQGP